MGSANKTTARHRAEDREVGLKMTTTEAGYFRVTKAETAET